MGQRVYILAVSQERRQRGERVLVSASNLLSFGLPPHLQVPALLLSSLANGRGGLCGGVRSQTPDALAMRAEEVKARAMGDGGSPK